MGAEDYLHHHNDKRYEVWPGFDCKYCRGSRGTQPCYEFSEKEGEKIFVCSVCGGPIPEGQIEEYRPPLEKQPVMRVLKQVEGIKPDDENFFNRFEGYKDFLKADRKDFERVYGVGEDTARRIYNRRELIYNISGVVSNVEDEFEDEIERYVETGNKEELRPVVEHLSNEGYGSRSKVRFRLEEYLQNDY